MGVKERILLTGLRHYSHPAVYNDSHLGAASPALYFFTGVAAILAIVGFASLILVCIWCSLANVNLRESTHQSNLEVTCSHDGPQNEKVLVIMPGEHKPTFVATQLSSVAHAAENRGL